MFAESYHQKISEDWLWREKELRQLDARRLKSINVIEMKSGILISYSHWEGHFKYCASELLYFIVDGIKRKLFKWTDLKAEIRQRILFCSYRKSSISGQSQETFISYLNALNDERYSSALNAIDQIILVDDNLNALRAEAICRNLGVDYSWCALKKIIIDERILEHRNAIAHGSRFLRSGDEMNLLHSDMLSAIDELRVLIRETRDRFANAITLRMFIGG